MFLGYQNNKIKFYTEKPLDAALYNLDLIEETQEEYVLDGDEYVLKDEAWEERERQRERQRLDELTLTPADVERALYKAKQMDFEDLKALIKEQLPIVDIKGLAIEFRARDFYRGAEANGMRLFDVVGALLDYTPDDMDYLFENKVLPEKVEPQPADTDSDSDTDTDSEVDNE